MINATPVRPLTSASPSGLPTPGASTPVPPAATPPTPPAANGGGMKPVPKKRFSMKMILGLIVFVIVAVGAVAGFYLTQMNQDTRQQASTAGCPAGSTPINAGTCQCANGGPVIPTTGTCPTAPPVNNCIGDGLACQGVAGNLRCLDGYAPENSKSCGNPGNSVCCKRIPDQPGPNCPAGSTPEGNFCRCNNNAGGNLINPSESCVATNCPDRSTPVTTGSNIGKCKCSETESNGSLVNPGGTCPPGELIQSCTAAGGTCKVGGCGDGFVGISNGRCTSAGSNCCKAATKCSDYGGANKCNSTTDSLNCAWDTNANKCNTVTQSAQTCAQVGGTCRIGSCGSGQTPNSAVCGQSGYVCCMGGAGGTPNTCEFGQGANIGGGTYQCQGTSSNLKCNTGYVPVTDSGVSCGAAGQKVCCKPAPPTTACPAGSTKILGGVDQGACKCTISGATVEPGGSCVATNCPAGTTAITSGVNVGKCTCPGGTGTLINPGQSCPTTGGGGSTGALCPNPPNLPAVKYVRFTCPNGCTKGADGAFHCYEQREDFTTNPGGLKNANDCGQVDVLSGTNDSSYCGYTVNTCLESRCQKQPTTSPTPTATPIGNMCINITMAVNGAAATSTTKPKIGDRLTFTCAQVPNATRYRFRVLEPGGSRINLNGTGRVSQQYGITVAGTFKAECSACTGSDNSTCTDWPSREN